jgi:hypothetical protein
MRILTHIIAVLLTAVLILFFINRGLSPINLDNANSVLQSNSTAIDKKIEEVASRLFLQVQGFSSTVVEDRDFAMKFLVEKDYSAPDIAEIASRYMRAMGFSFLEVTDTDYRILSSGHFPASAGNIAFTKKDMPDSTLIWIYDNIKGKKILSLQIKTPFSCEGVTLYCIGGVIADSSFISFLKPHEDITVILKHGNDILGIEDIETMSEIKENRIVINDKTWLASSKSLFWIGEESAPELFIIIKEPDDFSLLDLL